MQLTINRPSLTFSTTLLKPFLLVGVAAISSAALYSPLSSQSQNLKDKVNDSTLKPIIPYTEKGITGSKKLFETLGGWAKAGANSTDQVKDWIKSVAGGSVPNGAREIYTTLEEWAKTVYEFLKKFFTKEAWERFKENVKKLGQFLNLFKNIMKLQLGGNASIFDKFLGNSKLRDAMGGLVEKHPEILEQLSDKEFEDIAHALDANEEKVTKMIQDLADAPEEQATKEKLMNSIKESALIGRINKALAEANKIQEKGDKMTPQDKEKGQQVLKELEELHAKVTEILQKADKNKK